MENNALRVVYVFNNAEGEIELRVSADSVEQRDGWILAILRNKVVGGVKEECLKAFYFEANT